MPYSRAVSATLFTVNDSSTTLNVKPAVRVFSFLPMKYTSICFSISHTYYGFPFGVSADGKTPLLSSKLNVSSILLANSKRGDTIRGNEEKGPAIEETKSSSACGLIRKSLKGSRIVEPPKKKPSRDSPRNRPGSQSSIPED